MHITKNIKQIIKGTTINNKHIFINILNIDPKTSNNINECFSLVLECNSIFFSSGSTAISLVSFSLFFKVVS